MPEEFEKYGVVVDTEAEKVATREGRPCPGCGGKNVNYKGMTPHCPSCGTRPWERESNGTKQDHRR